MDKASYVYTALIGGFFLFSSANLNLEYMSILVPIVLQCCLYCLVSVPSKIGEDRT